MKKLIWVLTFLFLSPAFSMSSEKLTGALLSDTDFMNQVKSEIKGTFENPEKVTMDFAYAGASLINDSSFKATFYYSIIVKSDSWFGDTSFGTCPMQFTGRINNQTIQLIELVYDGCGE